MNRYFREINIFTTILLLVIITVSCVSTKTLIIEIPQQSKQELPQSIQSLTLVNRVVDSTFTNLDADSLQKIFYVQKFNYDTIINDIQAADTTIKALGELLFESGRYDFVIPENRFLKFKKNAFLTNEMSWTEVKELCKSYNTDAVLSLDHFKTRVSSNYSKESFYDSAQDGFSWVSYAKMYIYYEALFRVYDPIQEKVLVREFIRDTVVWEDVAGTTNILFSRFTPVKDALSEVGIAIALDFSDKISTTWHEENRKLFNKGDENLKQAALFAEDNKWDTATTLWMETLKNTKSKTVKSRAEFNIAVAFEMQGDLNKAITWALKSYETSYNIITYEYLDILKRRKYELKKQLR